MEIKRCEHIKTDGTQCGSPALRAERFCYFHNRCSPARLVINSARGENLVAITLPVLEDAQSIQVALMQVVQLIITGHIDNKTAGLLLYGLQTASANLRRARFEPMNAERVVIDPDSVADTPLNADQWSEEEEEEGEDELQADEEDSEDQEDSENEEVSAKPPDSTTDIDAVAEEKDKESRPPARRSPGKTPTISNAQFFRGLSRLAEHMESSRGTGG